MSARGNAAASVVVFDTFTESSFPTTFGVKISPMIGVLSEQPAIRNIRPANHLDIRDHPASQCSRAGAAMDSLSIAFINATQLPRE